MALLDEVARAGALLVAPRPADAHRRVEEIGDVAMADHAIAGVKDRHANGRDKVTPSRMDDAILDRHTARLLRRHARDLGIPDLHAAGTEVVQAAVANRDGVATAAEPEDIRQRLAEVALLEGEVFRAIGLDGRAESGFRLAEMRAFVRQRHNFEGERTDPENGDPSTTVFFRGIALEREPLRRGWRPDFRILQRFAGARHVGERAVAGEEPFPGRIESAAEILEVHPLRGLGLEEFVTAATCELQRSILGPKACDPMMVHVPRVVGEHIDIAQFPRRKPAQKGHVLGLHAQQRVAGVALQWDVRQRMRRLRNRNNKARVRRAGADGALSVDP